MSHWQPGAPLPWLRERAGLLGAMREFFAQRGVVEVQTPLITPCGVTEPQIQSMALARGGYLRSSPEYFHKRLLAAGFGDLYEIGPVLRDEESGRQHCPEFTLLEWYRLGLGWRALAAETIDLIRYCSKDLCEDWQLRQAPWRQLFIEHLDLDPLLADDRTVLARSAELPGDCDRSMRLDFLFSTRIQTRFPARQLTVVHGYPAAQAALACLDPADPRLAERFEVFAGTLELANGYHELTDPLEQRRRFEQDNERRKQLGRVEMPVDELLLAALDSGLPDCSGVALGVDRLLMSLLGSDSIGQVVAFT